MVTGIGINIKKLFTGVFALGSLLVGLGEPWERRSCQSILGRIGTSCSSP